MLEQNQGLHQDICPKYATLLSSDRKHIQFVFFADLNRLLKTISCRLQFDEYSFITLGNNGYAGSPSSTGGTRAWPGTISFKLRGNLFSIKALFMEQLA